MPATPEIPRGYFDLRTAAEFTGKTYQTIRNWSDELQPTEIRKVGTKVYVHAPSLIDLLIRKGKAAGVGGKETDPLLDGADSPGLERYRLAKAELAEMDLAKRKGEIIDAGELRPAMLALCSSLRRSHDAAVVKGGEPIRTILDAGMDEFVAAMSRVSNVDVTEDDARLPVAGDGDGAGHPTQPIPDDAAVCGG